MKIGFIGLDIMGNLMAKNLLKAGHKLVVYDIVAPHVSELVEAGANRLCPPVSADAVAEAIRRGMAEGFPATASESLYGTGHAARQVAGAIRELAQGGKGCP